ncbi:MAG TPA: hypothetical protein VNC50_15420, partial [Planctomycetia bacterium]|nr:hypothetical protein [Planctomycetia bacterium]
MRVMLPLAASLFFSASAWSQAPASSASPAASLDKAFPPGALAYAEITTFEPIANAALDGWRKAVEASPQYRQFRKSGQYDQAMAGKAIAEAYLGMSLEDLG